MIALTAPPIAAEEVTISLDSAIAAALDHSFAVKAARFDSLAAHEEYRAASAERFPTLSLEARSFYLSNLVKITSLPTPGAVELGTKENYQVDLRLAIPIYTGGKLSNRIGISGREVAAKGYDLESRRMTTAYYSRRSYLGLLLSDALVGAADASLKRTRTIKEDVAHLYDNGMADSVDILDAALAYEKGRSMLLEMQTGRRNASQSLAVVTGYPINTVFKLNEKIVEPEKKIEDYMTLDIDSTSLKRPELFALESRLAAADRMVALSRGGYLPNLSAFASYSGGKPNRDFFDAKFDDYFSVGAMLTWEFNLGFKTGHGVSNARRKREALRMSRDQLNESIYLEAKTDLEKLKNAYDIYRIALNEKNITEHKFRLAKAKQLAGDLSVNRLVEMEAELTAAEEQYSASIINFYLAETELLHTIGSPQIYGGLQ